jgi:hypothetical protein
MVDFSHDISNFQKYGTYIYQFDDVGNMTFNSSSGNFNQVYLAFPLVNVVYNPSKVQTLYDPTFVEFVPPVGAVLVETTSSVDLQQQLDVAQQQNISLQNQLNTLTIQNEASGSEADQMAVKQVILELREALGQGRVESDFSSDFPYTPIIKPIT